MQLVLATALVVAEWYTGSALMEHMSRMVSIGHGTHIKTSCDKLRMLLHILLHLTSEFASLPSAVIEAAENYYALCPLVKSLVLGRE